MASITIRLNELAQYLDWEAEPLELLQWIGSQLQYLPPDIREATEHYFTQEKYSDEYFKINSGRTALYALYRQSILSTDFKSDMQEAVDHFCMLDQDWSLKRAFYLADYLAYASRTQQEVVELCIKAAKIGIQLKLWEDTLRLAKYPFTFGFVNAEDTEELNRLARCARLELRHLKDYPEVDNG